MIKQKREVLYSRGERALCSLHIMHFGEVNDLHILLTNSLQDSSLVYTGYTVFNWKGINPFVSSLLTITHTVQFTIKCCNIDWKKCLLFYENAFIIICSRTGNLAVWIRNHNCCYIIICKSNFFIHYNPIFCCRIKSQNVIIICK